MFEVLDHSGVESCVLAGESLGAVTCVQAVLRQPDRFQGLVLVDGTPGTTRETPGALVDGSRNDYQATVRAFVDACVPEPDSDHIRRWGRQILLRAEPEAAARIFEAHYSVSLMGELGRVSVPTLVIHGEEDVIVPPQVGQAVAAAIPTSQLTRIPGAGHVPTLTRPAQVVEIIDGWARSMLPAA